MDDYTLEQLDDARHQFDALMRTARQNRERLNAELPRLIVGNILGVATLSEIEDVRRQLAECQQIFDETPGALVVLKGLIEQAREQQAQIQRQEAGRQLYSEYFATRREIIDNPKLVDAMNGPAGRFQNIATQLGRDAVSGMLFGQEAEDLIKKAREHTRYRKSEPFSFAVLIPESREGHD